jgi:signal transduction histidine kinase
MGLRESFNQVSQFPADAFPPFRPEGKPHCRGLNFGAFCLRTFWVIFIGMRTLLNYAGEKFSGLRFRLLLLVVIACTPLIGLTLHIAWDDRRRALGNWRQKAQELQQASALDEENALNKTRTLLLSMAQLQPVREGDVKGTKSLVDELARTYPRYAELGVLDTNGNIVASSAPMHGKSTSLSHAVFQKAIDLGELIVNERPTNNITGRPVLQAAFPIFDQTGRATGVVYACLTLNWFSRPNSELATKIPKQATWNEIAKDGTILVHLPSGRDWVGKPFPDKALLEAVHSGKEGIISVDDQSGVPTYVAFAPKQAHLLPAETMTVLTVPKDILFAGADRTLFRSLGWLVLAGGIPLLLIWIGSDFLIIRPVQSLVRSSTRLASGDLSVRTGLAPGRDELGRLTLAFDFMAQALEQRELEGKRATHKLQILSHRLVEVQETERRSIARELHDEIGQSLTVAEMNLQSALQSSKQVNLNRRLEASIEAVERVLEQVHDLSLNLRPSMLDDLGLEPALRWYANRQAALTGLRVRFKSDRLDHRFEPSIETECFRIAQEALNNAAKHSKATEVNVELRKNGEQLHLRVRDDGVGFDVADLREKAVRGASLGLLSMQERATLAGGGLEFNSGPGQGTEVHAWFPLRFREPVAEVGVEDSET